MVWEFEVTNVTREWTYSTTQGDEWADEAVVLLAPFTYAWSWDNGMIPGQLSPGQGSIVIAARTAVDLPVVEVGDVVAFSLDEADLIAGSDGSRVVEVTEEHVPNAAYAARLTISTADLLVDLPSLPVNKSLSARRRARERLAEIGHAIDRSIGLPTSAGAQLALPRYAREWPDNGREALTTWCNSAFEQIRGGVVTPLNDTAYAAGYEYCGPSSWTDTPIADPDSTIRYLIVDGNRISGTAGAGWEKPLRFVVRDGVLTLGPTDASVDKRMPSVSADYVEAPAQLRAGREHAPNTIRLSGVADWYNPTDLVYEERSYTEDWSGADAVLGGAPRARDVGTQLVLGTYDGTDTDAASVTNGEGDNPSGVFIADASQLAANRTYDSFTIYTEDMDDDDRESLLPRLAPHYPGNVMGGDGRLVRHLTVWRLAPEIRPGASSVASGYIVAGQIVVEHGEIRVEVTLTPGEPVYSGVTDLTVADLIAAGTGLTVGATDPGIAIADLAYVDH